MANILLIDPVTDRQIHLKTILKTAGYQVFLAEDLETALSLAAQHPPNLAIAPDQTEKLDGLTICQKLKFQSSSVTPFFLMMIATPETEERLLQQYPEIDDFLTLPIHRDHLLAHVRLGLQIHQLNQRVDQAQNQLLQNEKLLSLGQMVSGIAHEINNPVSLITGNISHATEYTQDILEILRLYTKKYPEPDPEIQDLIEELDLEYLMDDLPHVLKAMTMGASRIRKLVQSLRNFYSTDDAERKIINLQTSLDDILLILQGRLKGKQGQPIEVIKDYGALPSVECYPGQLNQVFMNILNNSIDALDILREKDPKFAPKIWIATESVTPESQVKIRIKDNGTGIPETIQTQIFKPFFTTKDPGKGTGFGLSVSHSIIAENHGGTIQCYSEIGQGSEFMIKIPITPIHS